MQATTIPADDLMVDSTISTDAESPSNAPSIAPSTTDASSVPRRRRLRGDRGEGVISAAIAVLIMAFLGAAMWIGFQQMWKTTEATTNDRISQIGSQ